MVFTRSRRDAFIGDCWRAASTSTAPSRGEMSLDGCACRSCRASSIDDRVDEGRFWNAASAIVMEAAMSSRQNRRACPPAGNAPPTLLQDGLADVAIQLEQLWDDLARTFNVDIFCPYSCHGLRCDDENQVFRDLRAAHSAVHVR